MNFMSTAFISLIILNSPLSEELCQFLFNIGKNYNNINLTLNTPKLLHNRATIRQELIKKSEIIINNKKIIN